MACRKSAETSVCQTRSHKKLVATLDLKNFKLCQSTKKDITQWKCYHFNKGEATSIKAMHVLAIKF